MVNASLGTLQFEEISTTTPQPNTTRAIYGGDCRSDGISILSTNQELFASISFSINICVYLNDQVEIRMTGPTDKWFGIGFDSKKMANTYSIVAYSDNDEDTVNEIKLGHHSPGSVYFDQMIDIIQDSNYNDERTVILLRNRTGINSEYFTFPQEPMDVDIIYAYGPAAEYVKSGTFII